MSNFAVVLLRSPFFVLGFDVSREQIEDYRPRYGEPAGGSSGFLMPVWMVCFMRLVCAFFFEDFRLCFG